MQQKNNINLRCSLRNEPQAQQYFTKFKVIVVPIFCACLIAAIGSATGLRHVTTMQFVVDRDTEYIVVNPTVLFIKQHQNKNIFS